MTQDGTSNPIQQSPSIRDNQKIKKRNKKETNEIKITSLSFAHMENRCHACGQPGHTSIKCA